MSSAVTLYDQTGTANTILDTGIINTDDISSLLIIIKASAGITAGTITTRAVFDDETTFDISGTTAPNTRPLAAGQTLFFTSWGEAVFTNQNITGTIQMILPRRVQIIISALGTGVTARVVVLGRRES